MLGHLEAVKARLEATGRKVYLIDVPEGESPPFPYFIVWASAGDLRALTLDGKQTTLDDSIGVTSAGITPESTLISAQKARDLLMDWKPTVGGWHTHELRLFDSRPVQPDRDQTLPNSNRHPYFAVDLFDVRAERLPVVAPDPPTD